jgi:hypothetical protein
MAAHSLVVPFLTDDPAFAFGVEFGLLYARLSEGDEEVADFFCRENQDRILLMAGRLGWHVEEMRPHDRDWFWCRLVKQLGAPTPPY